MRYGIPVFGRLILVIVLFALADVAAAQPDSVIQAVETAWKERDRQCQTIEIHWTQTVSCYKGGMSDLNRVKGRGDVALPLQDTVYSETLGLWLDEKKIRLERDGKTFDLEKEAFTPIKTTKVFDGVTGLSYRDQEQSPTPLNTGVRQRGEAALHIRASDLMPVLQAVRPASSAMAFIDLSKYRSTGRRVIIGGRTCIELAWAANLGRAANSVWVDPERGYAVVRRQLVASMRGSPYASLQEDVEYKEVAASVWLPDRWTIVNGGWTVPVSTRTEGQVVSVQVGAGGDKHPARFATTAPPRTVLTDIDEEDRRRVIVARDDGTEKDLGNASMAAAVKEVTGSSSVTSSWVSRHPLVFAGLVIGAVVVVGTALVRRARYSAGKRGPI